MCNKRAILKEVKIVRYEFANFENIFEIMKYKLAILRKKSPNCEI